MAKRYYQSDRAQELLENQFDADQGNLAIESASILDSMKPKIYCIEYFDGHDWDTDHARLSAERAEQFPLRDRDDRVTARIIFEWTDAEYQAKWNREFEDFGESVGWA